jgi:hypothetical protein
MNNNNKKVLCIQPAIPQAIYKYPFPSFLLEKYVLMTLEEYSVVFLFHPKVA